MCVERPPDRRVPVEEWQRQYNTGTGAGPPSMLVHVYTCAGWSVIQLEDEVDMRVVPHVRRVLGNLTPLVVVDLCRVTFMDASGLGLLGACQRKTYSVNGCVRLAGPSRQVRRLLALTQLDRSMSVFASLDEALSAPGPVAGGQAG